MTFAGPYPDATTMANHWWWRPDWSPGTRWYSWHVTVEEQPELQDLVGAYQGALAPVQTLDRICREWLHLTVQGIGNALRHPRRSLPRFGHVDTDAIDEIGHAGWMVRGSMQAPPHEERTCNPRPQGTGHPTPSESTNCARTPP